MEHAERIKKVGEIIKQIRESKGLTQFDIAVRCNIEQSSIARIENGRTNPTLITLIKISEALEIDIKELF